MTLLKNQSKIIAINTGEFFYYLGLVKSFKEESGAAIYYGKKAMSSFTENYNFMRILHSLLLLGINYTHAGIYKEAEECFDNLLRNTQFLKDTETLLPTIYHNMGYLYNRQNDSSTSLLHYQKSLELTHEDSPQYLVTLFSYAETLFKDSNQECLKFFQRLKKLSRKQKNVKYYTLANYYLLATVNPEEGMIFLEEKTLPILKRSQQHISDLHQYFNRLADYYQSKKQYKQANHYINQIRRN